MPVLATVHEAAPDTAAPTVMLVPAQIHARAPALGFDTAPALALPAPAHFLESARDAAAAAVPFVAAEFDTTRAALCLRGTRTFASPVPADVHEAAPDAATAAVVAVAAEVRANVPAPRLPEVAVAISIQLSGPSLELAQGYDQTGQKRAEQIAPGPSTREGLHDRIKPLAVHRVPLSLGTVAAIPETRVRESKT